MPSWSLKGLRGGSRVRSGERGLTRPTSRGCTLRWPRHHQPKSRGELFGPRGSPSERRRSGLWCGQDAGCTLRTLALLFACRRSPANRRRHHSAEGMTALTELLDRKAAVRALRSVAPKDWPVLGYSARIRLLPLLLATSGAESDALEVAAQLSIEAAARDQSLPNYGTFHDALRQRFAV